jgi:hypothetical protein
MLDYAANAVVYWSVEKVRASFEARCQKDGLDPEVLLSEFVGEGQEVAAFWQKVKTNFQAGRVRLIFIADEIPPELRRVVEFLNSQMDPAEVLAIEVKQFVGEHLKTLVPRVLGLMETARQKKVVGSGETRQWDEASFFDALLERRGQQEVVVARRLLEWAKERSLRVGWGQGTKDGSFFPMYDNKFGKNFLFSVWTYGTVELQFQHMRQPPFSDEGKRKELAARLTTIPGVSIPDGSLNKRPSFKLGLLADKSSLATFLEAFDWVLGETRQAEVQPLSPVAALSESSDHETPA